ncbi:unnamed protein product [Closterium sp. NIES-64]|nr:unnamed protein product [Closterium sp. NIES-64]
MFFSLPPYAGQSPFPTPTLIRWRSHLLSPPLTPCDTVPIPLSSYISLAPPSLSLFLLPTSLRRAVPFPYSYAHPLCLCPNPALTLFPPALLFYSPFPRLSPIAGRSRFPSPPLTPCDTVPIPLSSYCSLEPPSLSHVLLPTSHRSAVPFPYSYAHPLCLLLNPALILFPHALLFYSPFLSCPPLQGGPIFPLLLSPVVTLSQSLSHPTAPLNHHPFPSFFSLPPIAAQSPFPTPTLIRCASFPIPLSSFSLMRYCSIHPFLSCPPLQGGPIFPLLLSPLVTLSQSRSHPTAPLNHHPFPSFFSLPPFAGQSPFPSPTLIRCASVPIPLSSFPPHQSRESHLPSPPLTPCDTVPIPLSSYCTLAPPSLPLFLLPTSLRRAVPFPYSNAHPLVGATQDEARVHGLDEAEHVAVTEEHAEVPVGAPQDEGDTVGVGGADSTAGEAVHEESSPTRMRRAFTGWMRLRMSLSPKSTRQYQSVRRMMTATRLGWGGADSTAGEAVHEESTPTRVDAAQRTDGSGRKKRSLPGWPESPSLAELSGSLMKATNAVWKYPLMRKVLRLRQQALAAGSGKKELVGGLGGRTCADGRVFKRRKVNEVTPPGDISAHRNGASGRSVEGNVNVQEEGGSIAERGSGGADTDATGGPHADGQFTEERGGMEDVQWDDVSEMFGYDPHPVHGVRPCSETSFLLIQASISS